MFSNRNTSMCRETFTFEEAIKAELIRFKQTIFAKNIKVPLISTDWKVDFSGGIHKF